MGEGTLIKKGKLGKGKKPLLLVSTLEKIAFGDDTSLKRERESHAIDECGGGGEKDNLNIQRLYS